MANESKSRSLRAFFIAWIVLTIAGVLISIWAPHRYFPISMSNDMRLTVSTTILFSICAAPVAAGVYAASFYILLRYRYRGEGVPPAAPQVRDSTKFVVTWLTASAVLCVFVLVWGLGALAAENSASTRNPLVVDVTGQQWIWSFSYPGSNVESNELYLPKGREVEFRVTSEDVPHGFWIVNMGVQVDANPGVITTIHTIPDRLGDITVRCEQFCGLNHAFMDAEGKVVTPSQFQTWLTSQSEA